MEAMRVGYLLKKIGMMERTRLDQAVFRLEACVLALDEELLLVEMEKVRTASKADKREWHEAFQNQSGSRTSYMTNRFDN